MNERNELLLKAIEVSKYAGILILNWYRNDSCAVAQKIDASPLTEADLASNAYIVSALAETDIPVISEEVECDYAIRKRWDSFWLVDPLDGTKDFLGRNGEFTVNIALIENGLPVLGVIHAPDISHTYYALKGSGSFCETKGRIYKLPYYKSHSSVIATVSRQHLSATTKAFLKMNGISSFEPKGSSLKFGVVASGKADIYPRFEGSMEWDIAAGDIIASEAGCQIIDLVTRSSPVYNKPSMLNNPFIVYAPHMKTKNLSMPDVNTSS